MLALTLRNGAKKTGVCVFHLEEHSDESDYLYKAFFPHDT